MPTVTHVPLLKCVPCLFTGPSKEAAQAEVETYAPAQGRLPAVLLSAMPHRGITINAGYESWGGGLIHTDKGKDYIRRGLVEEVFVHEAAHVALDSGAS